MIKTFYKRSVPVKTFFAPSLPDRSTAYGENVQSEFLRWFDYWTERWNSRGGNCLICAQGDVSGNPVRGDVPADTVRRESAAAKKYVGSVLPPLWFGRGFFELGADGYVFVNGEKSALYTGTEIKAWALMPLPASRDGREGAAEYLAVIGKPGAGKCSLALYDVSRGAPQPMPIALCELPVTLAPSDHLVCLGRHIFALHERELLYFYFSPESGELEKVCLPPDGDPPWKDGAMPQIVCDGAGRVYFAAGGDVYGFTIGYPGQVRRVCSGANVARVQCFREKLYVYRSDRGGRECRAVCEQNGKLCESAFNSGAEMNMFTAELHDTRYIKLVKTEHGLTASAARNASGAETLMSSERLPGAKTAFCFCGSLIENARYAGLDEKRNIVAVY